ncbi:MULTISPECIES: diflavin oxidoreductase [unclassified Carboxylicivirga]|uniref:diflavin oxidoreductase n=1 Tax=Carboxylicivirga TaxID=1628153 RepID=UPI003D328252
MMETLDNCLYVLFGSRTGNSKAVATLAHEYAQSLGYASVLSDMQHMNFDDIKQVQYLLLIVSTHGEGEPPVQAEDFYSYLHSDSPGKLATQYAVLGLGDSSYRYFCQTGEDLDKRLAALGGRQLMPLKKCDIDFEETAKNWILQAFESLEGQLPRLNKPRKKGFIFDLKLNDNISSAYKAELIDKHMLTTAHSSKKVLHVSLSLKNSGIEYLPGDALGVYGTNARSMVDELLDTLNFDKAYPVKEKDSTRLLKDLLIHDYELTLITPLVVRNYASLVNNPKLNHLLSNKKALENYTSESDIIDLVKDYPGKITVEQLLSVLRKLSQRLYSIASSRNAVGDRADITVKIIENTKDGRTRHGVCSSFLWERLDVSDRVPVTLETIAKFRLPEDDHVPIIMIAAGTGIAPYRAFLQERAARKAPGKNWLIFGERNRNTDYLYEEELIAFKQVGYIEKINTAFSRDQKEKFYVSHLIEQSALEIIQWIQDGAIVYVCGSKDHMAVSVRQSLIKAIAQVMHLDNNAAIAYFETLKAAKQYQEEVY